MNHSASSFSSSQVTQLIQQWKAGNHQALDQLMPLVYDTLYKIALSRFAEERPGHTLQPTALINELYLKLIDEHKLSLEDRSQFYGAASVMMRNILIDSARKHRAAKRGNQQKVQLEEGVEGLEKPSRLSADEMIALGAALERLRELDERQAQIVDLRFFVGLKEGEIAEIMGITDRHVRREWSAAKAWLYRELKTAGA